MQPQYAKDPCLLLLLHTSKDMAIYSRWFSILTAILDMLINTAILVLASLLMPFFSLLLPLCRIRKRSSFSFSQYLQDLGIRHILFSLMLSLLTFLFAYLALLNLQFLQGYVRLLYTGLLAYIYYALLSINVYADAILRKEIAFSKFFFTLNTQFPKFLVYMFGITMLCIFFWKDLFLLIVLLYPGLVISLILKLHQNSFISNNRTGVTN